MGKKKGKMGIEEPIKIDKMIVIIDYGLGNIHSVAGAVKKLGYQPMISSRIEDMEKAEKLILPGVGAFADGMKNLKNLDLLEPLTRLVMEKRKPILGICLGFQLMSNESYEFGHHNGLGWIDSQVIRLNPKKKELRIPHVGWDELIQVKENPLFDNIPKESLFYYVHSFHLDCQDKNIVIGKCDYGLEFTAAIQQENIFGTQFHPEKSQLHGLKLLENYLKKC